MENNDIYPRFLPTEGLKWRGVLKGIPKAQNVFQPLFEAITNSIEAIDLRRNNEIDFSPYIIIDIFFNKGTDGSNVSLAKINVTDNGIGFNDENFKRFLTFKDDSKGFNNKGSGRIQIVHSFVQSIYTSIYRDAEGSLRKRVFIMSKAEEFLRNNAISQIVANDSAETGESVETILSMNQLHEKCDDKIFCECSIDSLRNMLINHYIMRFCAYGTSLPKLTINYHNIESIEETRTITNTDIPTPYIDNKSFFVPKYKISSDFKRLEQTDEQVEIKFKSFKLPSSQLDNNTVRFTCKKELVESLNVRVPKLPKKFEIDASHFLILLSSTYFDETITDTRDDFEILSKTEFKKRAKIYGDIEPQIVFDDVQDKVADVAAKCMPEIAKQYDNQQKTIEELKRIYFLSEDAISEADIDDSVEDILIKAYSYDAKLIAKQDAVYQQKQKLLASLDTTSPTYKEDLEAIVIDLVKQIPLQRKESLSRYITHRTLVLDLFERLIGKDTDIQKESDRSIDERLIHNLILNQHGTNSEYSDIWMLNEDYLYYEGCSEHPLKDVTIGGKKLFLDIIDEVESQYINSLGENRLAKRPDILLFPDEHKCIIIELKSLDANVSKYLHQINQYASFIRSYTTKDFYIDTFYGYLIGEALEPNDVRAADADFRFDSGFNYCYRPAKTIACLTDATGKQDGHIYTEVLSFSVLLKRARGRNEAFKQRLIPTTGENTKSN